MSPHSPNPRSPELQGVADSKLRWEGGPTVQPVRTHDYHWLFDEMVECDRHSYEQDGQHQDLDPRCERSQGIVDKPNTKLMRKIYPKGVSRDSITDVA